jgi:hypothetical protein
MIAQVMAGGNFHTAFIGDFLGVFPDKSASFFQA